MKEETIGQIIAIFIFGNILFFALVWASEGDDAMNYCKSKGYDGLLKPNFFDNTRTINGTQYAQCYREQIINNTLIRTTAWLPFKK